MKREPVKRGPVKREPVNLEGDGRLGASCAQMRGSAAEGAPPPRVRRLRELLRLGDEALGFCKLPRCGLDDTRLSPNCRARAHGDATHVADGEGEQVRRERASLLEGEGAQRNAAHDAGDRRAHGHRAHQGRGPLRHTDRGVVRKLGGRPVRAREHGARVDSLALAEHERPLLARGLGGRQPLQCRRLGRGGVGDGDLECSALLPEPLGQRDGARDTECSMCWPHRVRRGCAAHGHGAHLKLGRGVQNELSHPVLSDVHSPRGDAFEYMALEID